jgi:hypothetical protein
MKTKAHCNAKTFAFGKDQRKKLSSCLEENIYKMVGRENGKLRGVLLPRTRQAQFRARTKQDSEKRTKEKRRQIEHGG